MYFRFEYLHYYIRIRIVCLNIMSNSPKYDLTIILPAYNEESNLEKCIRETVKAVDSLNASYEIIIVENGSKDNTFKIAQKLAEEYPVIRPIHMDTPNVSKAIRNGYNIAKGNVVINLDVDLSTDMSHLRELFEYSKEYDIVTGSRYVNKTMVKRTFDRLFLSVVFNKILVRGLLGSKLKDNNCGFRALKRDVAVAIFAEIKDDNFFGLVELIIRAQKKGYKIKEFPVNWKENPRRIGLKRIMDFLIPALKLWLELLMNKKVKICKDKDLRIIFITFFLCFLYLTNIIIY